MLSTNDERSGVVSAAGRQDDRADMYLREHEAERDPVKRSPTYVPPFVSLSLAQSLTRVEGEAEARGGRIIRPNLHT